MIGNVPETYQGWAYSLADAEAQAAVLQAQGRETKIAESMYHLGTWVVYATLLEGETR